MNPHLINQQLIYPKTPLLVILTILHLSYLKGVVLHIMTVMMRSQLMTLQSSKLHLLPLTQYLGLRLNLDLRRM
jgi:hypothetical protein